jgi:hypothetical protein
MMKYSNLFHNVANTLIVLLGAIEFYDWGIFFDPGTAVKIAGGLALAKIVINVGRDGFGGLAAEQPPVVTPPDASNFYPPEKGPQ